MCVHKKRQLCYAVVILTSTKYYIRRGIHLLAKAHQGLNCEQETMEHNDKMLPEICSEQPVKMY